MPLSDLRNIPTIMTSLGWNKGADLLNNWFKNPAYTRSASGVTKFEYDNAYHFGALDAWLFSQAEGKTVWNKIFTKHLWRSNNPEDGDAVSKLGRLLNAEGILKPGIKDVRFGYKTYPAKEYEKNKTFLNASSFITNPTTPLTHCIAALGSFNLKIALNGKVSQSQNATTVNRYTVTPESIDIYLWDLFDFEDPADAWVSQPLGFWDEVTNTVSKMPGQGKVYVNNTSFRDWRTANNMGMDFYLYSDVYRYTLSRPSDLLPFEIIKP